MNLGRKRRSLLRGGLLVLLLAADPASRATDAPHDVLNAIDCTSCHQGHNAAGMNLTTAEGNANLCLSCHQISQAHVAAFFEADEADLFARRGFHHRWDSGAAGYVKQTVASGGSTGTMRSGGAYAGTEPKRWVVTITGGGGAATAAFSWTATGGSGGSGAGTCGAEVALDDGVTLTCRDGDAGAVGPCGTSFCAGDAWTVYASGASGSAPTDPELLARMPDGKAVCSTCHDQHGQGNAAFTERVVDGRTWRHFMRVPNDAGQLCRQCHADRFPDAEDPAYPFDLTRSWTGAPRSHPVDVALGSNGKGYDRAAPLDATGVAQTTGDGIASNDLIFTLAGHVTCLTCHGVHAGAADGNGRTE